MAKAMSESIIDDAGHVATILSAIGSSFVLSDYACG